MNLLEQLIALSRRYGADPSFVLAGGGNTSVKSVDRLWVKASGVALDGIGADGFVEMDRAALQSLMDEDLPADPSERERRFKDAIMAARLDPSGLRPSVECALHHLLPSRFVVHTHATVANSLACCVRGEEIALDLFGDTVLWLPYTDPGVTLAHGLKDALEGYRARTGQVCPPAILMANHGLIVCGGSPEEIDRHTEAVLRPIREHLGACAEPFGSVTRLPDDAARSLVNVFGPALRGLLSEGGPLRVVTFDDSEEALWLAAAERGREIAAGGPLTPDQIVYCTSFPLWSEASPEEEPASLVEGLRKEIQAHLETQGFLPKVLLVRGLGLFAAGDSYRAATTVCQVYRDAIRVMAGAEGLGGISYLPERERRFIEDWEVESYRRQVSAGANTGGRMEGRIAVVTGAAQGLGLGIARGLAAQGASVVLADVNADGAGREANVLCNEHGPGRAAAVSMDVTRPESVADALHTVVRRYGGLDLLVSNAGVLRAGSVKTQTASDFDLVTSVNYRGYFLCVQAAAPVMAVQRLARPDRWSDIIQVNSKSGLTGSNRNGAYAGSKFGSIGLTQSFALELVDDGIKVNAVCPGNYFDGPLWSDPKNGLFAQYLRAGKVPRAKDVEDVRRFYESKVPMGRGVTVEDVVTAILYLVEQQYETGQALPVTGGQVMK